MGEEVVPTYVVVSTHNRHEMLRDCLESCADADRVFCIDNASSPPVTAVPDNVEVIRDEEQPPNLSRLWNLGLNAARDNTELTSTYKYNVAIINDDVILPPGWLGSVAAALRAHGSAVVAHGDQFGILSTPRLNTKAETTNAFNRMTGFAHMTRGELGLRFDESMKYWYSDDDYDWRARQRGGVLALPGLAVVHRDENGHFTKRPELQEQARLDGLRFTYKWGMPPT